MEVHVTYPLERNLYAASGDDTPSMDHSIRSYSELGVVPLQQLPSRPTCPDQTPVQHHSVQHRRSDTGDLSEQIGSYENWQRPPRLQREVQRVGAGVVHDFFFWK